MTIKKILLSIGTISISGLSTLALVSCGSIKPSYIGGSKSLTNRVEDVYQVNDISTGFGDNKVLKDTSYNKLYDEMMKTKDTVAIAVIANGKVYTDIVKTSRGETVIQALDSSRFIFKRYMHEYMGAFINSFALRNEPDVYMHGTRTEKNYGDYYPLYFINHKFSQLGVSNFKLAGHEMLEFSYDDK